MTILRRNDPLTRIALVKEVQDFMLNPNNKHWESVDEHSMLIANIFSSARKGKKAEVLEAVEKQANWSGKLAMYPSLLQIVYRIGARVHVLMPR